jgi:hypothetical protein
MIDHTSITKGQFYRYGGFSNPRCVRVTRSGAYAHFWRN